MGRVLRGGSRNFERGGARLEDGLMCGVRSTPKLGGSGGMPPQENFEK